ncbi:MAG: T9SS type A sorting domain-containing protein [Putridiphycobacter sp.]|nr:T9SS type A sorting domain-containing protein [Putridiphycobacter sp.]
MKIFLISIFSLITMRAFAQPYLVQDVNPSTNYPGVHTLSGAEYNDWYYYAGDDSLTGFELWKTNGDTCILVADLFQGTNVGGWQNGSGPSEFIVFNNKLYFTAIDSVEGVELWCYDELSAPALVTWIPFVATAQLNAPIDYSLRVFNGELYILRTAYNFAEMYKYDGVSATQIAIPLTGGAILNEFQGNLILAGTCNSCANSAFLWQFDGSVFTQIANAVLHTNASNTGINQPNFRTRKTAVYQNNLYFPGYDSLHGFELWKFDGSTASLALDILPGSNSGFFESNGIYGGYRPNLILYNNLLCFVATDSIHGAELWQYDGNSAQMIQDVNQYNASLQSVVTYPLFVELFDDKLYFSHSAYSDGSVPDSVGLFVYDGSTIQAVADIYPNHVIGTNPYGLKTVGPYMYFYATDSMHGRELWRLESCNIQNSGSQSVTACQEYMSLSGEPIYNSGILKDTLTNSCGGDSIVTTYLTVNTVDAAITQNGFELQANSTNATYQWIDCDNGGTIIAGETNQVFEPTSNGNYAVIVTDIENGCIDTSACATIAGLGEGNTNQYQFNIYPNPSTGALFISSAMNLSTAQISAYTVLGQVLSIKTEILNDGLKITLPELPTSMILLKIETPHGVFLQKVRVE